MTRVLIVDDELLLAEGLQEALVAEGMEADIALTGSEALTSAEPDILLLDYTLPDFTGLQVLELLRKQGKTVPVLIMSGKLWGVEQQRRLEALGVRSFLYKPFDLLMVPQYIRAALVQSA